MNGEVRCAHKWVRLQDHKLMFTEYSWCRWCGTLRRQYSSDGRHVYKYPRKPYGWAAERMRKGDGDG